VPFLRVTESGDIWSAETHASERSKTSAAVGSWRVADIHELN
jgi:hypothetical protein